MKKLFNKRHVKSGLNGRALLSGSIAIMLAAGLSACADMNNQFAVNSAAKSEQQSNSGSFKARDFGLASILLSDNYRERVYIGDADHDFVHFAEPGSLNITESIFVGAAPSNMWMDANGRYLHAELEDLQRVAIVDVERAKLLEYRDINEYRRASSAEQEVAERYVAQHQP